MLKHPLFRHQGLTWPWLQTKYTVDSTEFCSTCNLEVKVGLGGEHNWNAHLKSSAHLRKLGASAQKPKTTLKDLWEKATRRKSPAPAPPLTVKEPEPLLSQVDGHELGDMMLSGTLHGALPVLSSLL